MARILWVESRRWEHSEIRIRHTAIYALTFWGGGREEGERGEPPFRSSNCCSWKKKWGIAKYIDSWATFWGFEFATTYASCKKLGNMREFMKFARIQESDAKHSVINAVPLWSRPISIASSISKHFVPAINLDPDLTYASVLRNWHRLFVVETFFSQKKIPEDSQSVQSIDLQKFFTARVALMR